MVDPPHSQHLCARIVHQQSLAQSASGVPTAVQMSHSHWFQVTQDERITHEAGMECENSNLVSSSSLCARPKSSPTGGTLAGPGGRSLSWYVKIHCCSTASDGRCHLSGYGKSLECVSKGTCQTRLQRPRRLDLIDLYDRSDSV